MFQLTSENITMSAGGPMGTPSTTNFVRYFWSAATAKLAAEKDLGRGIKWRSLGRGNFASPDLGHVMYYVEKVKVE
jgi:hypothetical protein